MPTYSKITPRVAALAALLCSIAACVTAASIGDITDNPRKYEGKTVTVEGDVTAVYSLLVIKYFELNDGTGVIGVVSDKPLPRKGERLRVTGTVREAFSLGDKSMTVLVEEPAESASTNRP